LSVGHGSTVKYIKIGIAEGAKLINRVCSLISRFEGYRQSVMETMFKQFFNQRFQGPL
jgi:hypothetical protein